MPRPADAPPPVSDLPQQADLYVRFGFVAAAVVAFATLLAFTALDPQALARPLIGPVPTSLVIATAMILFAILLTGLYVLIADRTSRR